MANRENKSLMKRIVYALLAASLLGSCQNELYNDPAKDHQSEQGIYIHGQEQTQIFLLSGASQDASGPRVSLVKPATSTVTVNFSVGSQAQLDAYNAKNGTSYKLLPSTMYELPASVTIPAGQTSASIPVKLKAVTFSSGEVFALPIQLQGSNPHAIGGQSEAIIVVDQATETKALSINTGNEIAAYFAEDILVPQWTMEVMVKRSNINGALAGTSSSVGRMTRAKSTLSSARTVRSSARVVLTSRSRRISCLSKTTSGTCSPSSMTGRTSRSTATAVRCFRSLYVMATTSLVDSGSAPRVV